MPSLEGWGEPEPGLSRRPACSRIRRFCMCAAAESSASLVAERVPTSSHSSSAAARAQARVVAPPAATSAMWESHCRFAERPALFAARLAALLAALPAGLPAFFPLDGEAAAPPKPAITAGGAERPLLTRSDAERHVGDRSAAGARRADMR